MRGRSAVPLSSMVFFSFLSLSSNSLRSFLVMVRFMAWPFSPGDKWEMKLNLHAARALLWYYFFWAYVSLFVLPTSIEVRFGLFGSVCESINFCFLDQPNMAGVESFGFGKWISRCCIASNSDSVIFLLLIYDFSLSCTWVRDFRSHPATGVTDFVLLPFTTQSHFCS